LSLLGTASPEIPDTTRRTARVGGGSDTRALDAVGNYNRSMQVVSMAKQAAARKAARAHCAKVKQK